MTLTFGRDGARAVEYVGWLGLDGPPSPGTTPEQHQACLRPASTGVLSCMYGTYRNGRTSPSLDFPSYLRNFLGHDVGVHVNPKLNV